MWPEKNQTESRNPTVTSLQGHAAVQLLAHVLTGARSTHTTARAASNLTTSPALLGALAPREGPVTARDSVQSSSLQDTRRSLNNIMWRRGLILAGRGVESRPHVCLPILDLDASPPLRPSRACKVSTTSRYPWGLHQ